MGIHLSVLKKFTYYFHDKAEQLIARHAKDRFKSLILNSAAHPQHYLPQEKKEVLSHERFPLANNRKEFLTSREIECIHWLSQGKSSEEIGIILHLSRRTVETHLLNAKKKMRCYKMTQLIYLAQKLALI